MFLYRTHKTISHKQASLIGFTLAVISLLVTAIVAYLPPLVVSLLYTKGISHLEIFFFLICIVLFLVVQGLLFFGIPLWYANEKKNNMTGFQIVVYGLFWMLVLYALVAVVSGFLFSTNTPVMDLNSLGGQEIQIEEPQMDVPAL